MANLTANLTFQAPRFDCDLQCQQCLYRKEDGEQCRKRTCMSLPYCWTHTKMRYGVKVVKKKDFEGLIATRSHDEGSFIIPFVGELLTLECMQNRYTEGTTPPYLINQSGEPEEPWLDAACYRGAGAATKYHPVNFNADWVYNESDDSVWLVAQRHIMRSEEIIAKGPPSNLEHKTRRSKKEDTRPC